MIVKIGKRKYDASKLSAAQKKEVKVEPQKKSVKNADKDKGAK